MNFSRVRVNPDIRELSHLHQVLRGNSYGVHQMLWDLFPGGKERTFLFREEIAGEQIPHYKGASVTLLRLHHDTEKRKRFPY